jgi:hypothetical protein
VPITYELDREHRLVRATVRGDFTADEMLGCVTGAAREAGEPGWNILSDHREIGEPATREQLEQLVGHLAVLRRYFHGSRWAVVVARPASYGMMRMLQVLAERVPMTVRVFVDAARGERWALGAPDDDLADGDVPPHPWPATP